MECCSWNGGPHQQDVREGRAKKQKSGLECLPLHLWTGEILKKVGDGYGGFVALDEETTFKKDLQWVRILVKKKKKNNTEKLSSVNLLARARSYELQIWWEIQPTVAGVYPYSSRAHGVPVESCEEDSRSTRAFGRVGVVWAVPRHTSREAQRDVGQTPLFGNGAAAGDLSQGQEVGSSSKEGDKNGFEIQKSRRDRVLEEESKAHLKDINIDNNGPHLECVMGQNPFPSRGAFEGQCPLRLRVQNFRSKGGNAKDNRWVKRKGSDTGKMKGTANHSCGESQASEATMVDEGGCQELISTQSIGGSGEKKYKAGTEQRGEKLHQGHR